MLNIIWGAGNEDWEFLGEGGGSVGSMWYFGLEGLGSIPQYVDWNTLHVVRNHIDSLSSSL